MLIADTDKRNSVRYDTCQGFNHIAVLLIGDKDVRPILLDWDGGAGRVLSVSR